MRIHFVFSIRKIQHKLFTIKSKTLIKLKVLLFSLAGAFLLTACEMVRFLQAE